MPYKGWVKRRPDPTCAEDDGQMPESRLVVMHLNLSIEDADKLMRHKSVPVLDADGVPEAVWERTKDEMLELTVQALCIAAVNSVEDETGVHCYGGSARVERD